MSKIASTLVFILGFASAASAQDTLLPTYINDTGQVTVTGQIRYAAGTGTLKNPAFDVDFDDSIVLGELRAAVGIGGRFEIEAALPFAFSGTGEADESGVEFELETAGVGDLSVEFNYAIVPESTASPQVFAGLVLILPSGNDDFGTPEIRINGVQVQQGEDGGIGDGVFKAGLQFGVSKKLTGAHVYALARFIVATETQEQDDIEIDHPDTFDLVAGALLPLGSSSNLDLRLTMNYLGDEIEEDTTTSAESTEEAHVRFVLDALLYFTVGDTATIVIGANVGMTEDHAIDEEAELDLEEVFTYGFVLGLHLNLGGGK